MIKIPITEYHQMSELSSSQIRQLLKNPYEFLNPIVKSSQTLDFGSAFHKIVLEPEDFSEEFAVCPTINRRTKKGKEEYDAFLCQNEGKIILSQEDFTKISQMKQSLMATPAKKLLQNGVAEMSFFSKLEGIGVRCRPDYYLEDRGIIIDLKTTTDASPDSFSKSCASFGYYIQASFYLDILKSLGYRANNFVFVVVSKVEPFMVGIYELDPIALDFGRSEYKRALEIYKNIDKYKTPIYKDTKSGDVVQTITLPNWVFYKKDANY